MSTIKRIILIVFLNISVVSTFAQTLEDGKKALYYERYKTAKTIFEKLVAADPNNLNAVYLLGQSIINKPDASPKDIEDAKNIYLNSLSKNTNSGLLLAGVGHAEMKQGKLQDARNHFETAISLSQGKNIDVLKAIGAANIAAEDKYGDANFAIEKLKQATAIKNFKDPEVYCLIGDAYRILLDGGNAQTAYEAAFAIDPNYARAYYRIGKIYQTQGVSQEELYLKYYEDALAKDPTYGPVYENYYKYYYQTNVTKSAEYLQKFLDNTEDDPKNCYYRASMKYAQGLFSECIAAADDCIKNSPEPYPNLYGLKAYAYDKMGDSINAKSGFDIYFSKQLPEKIVAADYITYAKVLFKIPGNDSLVFLFAQKAVLADPLEANKINFLKDFAVKYEALKKYKDAADYYNKMLLIKKDPRKTDYYNAGYNFFRSGNYQPSIEVFNQYAAKFPEDPFSHYMIGKANWAIDTTLDLGLANPYFEKAIAVGLADSIKYKNQLIGSYKYFVVYSATKKKDYATALFYCDKILALDPNDVEALNNKKALSTPASSKKPVGKQSAFLRNKSPKSISSAT